MKKNSDRGITIIIPCYNEADSILKTVEKLHGVMRQSERDFEIIIVNDASTDDTAEKLTEITCKEVKILANDFNLGYGASIKNGIETSSFSWIGITDADGTYPIERFPDLFEHMEKYDMVVGTRTGKIRAIPLLRRPAKWFLNRFSSYLVKRKINDVNSGMRIFKKEIARKYWNFFPNGFSFTTTLTLALIMGNYRTKNITIDYFKRKGRSKIHPIKDTYNFILLILRITMLFNPLRIFMPIFFMTMFLTFFSLGWDIYNINLTDTTVMLFIFSVIILMIGLLADLINKRFPR
ncbi:MAG: glycosyltransferase family 2 protein [Candidatus Aminicenantes bacterium]|nr:glycosyltransferase family 2 protein [Candidatus Aminicenantes bacterium]